MCSPTWLSDLGIQGFRGLGFRDLGFRDLGFRVSGFRVLQLHFKHSWIPDQGSQRFKP